MPSIVFHNPYSIHHVRLKKPLENLADWFPVVIGHIDGEFRVVDIQPIILVPDEAPVEAVFGGVGFERIELIINLRIDIFALAFGFAALGLNHPDCPILFHNDVVCIEQPLVAEGIQIDDGEILLAGIAVFIDPFDIVPALAILLEQLL